SLFGKDYDHRSKSSVLNNFYVDDCLLSVPSVTDAKNFVQGITELLSKGKSHLHKWVSTFPDLLQGITPSERMEAVVEISPKAMNTHQALGIEWDPSPDTPCFRFHVPEKPEETRGILASVCLLFDPLGLVAPLCLTAEQLLQEL
ncbi:hypothetical protein CRM22_008856, partial [Opisthorchis felineus]